MGSEKGSKGAGKGGGCRPFQDTARTEAMQEFGGISTRHSHDSLGQQTSARPLQQGLAQEGRTLAGPQSLSWPEGSFYPKHH